MTVKAVLVDLDGTLADTETASAAAYAEALAEVGVGVGVGELARCAHGRHWSQFLPEILAGAGRASAPGAVAERKRQIYEARLAQIRINHALASLIAFVRPMCRTGLVTTAASGTVTALLTCHGLDGHFDIVVTGCDVEFRKPHPEAYLRAAHLLGVAPQECLVFEDSDVGVAAAKAAGARVIRVAAPAA
ncbi:HAD family hydrolase [Blastochloris sulfoviridis]|uniref:HAD family phosphatase n=1 Tax=Blastochloris sulfoviridis TaxID=50712 RepID=A0A5M6I3U4_9HYPH|nr:HAD family phosphatase [Blastochloris sulfoviridis]KAA5602519.1 HAD family phosphatase [Blastochloris sulfoviridis]